MIDILERLRGTADEIERLRTANDGYQEQLQNALNALSETRAALMDLLDAYLADVNPNDRNQAAIEHARRNISG